MSLYKNKFNPLSGSFNLVPTATIVTFKDGVANAAALPVSGNALNDGRITADTGHLYVWDGTTWVDQGDIIDLKWSAIDGKPSSSVVNIDDAVSKKHSNSLDHTQGTDQGLDTGGVNAVTAAQAKAGYSHSQVAHAPSDAVSLATVKADTDIDNAIDNTHAPHSDDQVIPTALSALSDDATHRLVTDTEKSTWNEISDVALNVMLNAFRIAQIGSLTIFNMVKGFVDEYEDESGVDLVNSSGQVYDNLLDCYKSYSTIDSETKLLLHLDNDVVDSELTPKTVTNTDVTFSTSSKFGTHAASFNGTSSYLSVPNSSDWNLFANNTDLYTVDFWIKHNDYTTAQRYLAHYDSNSNNWNFVIDTGVIYIQCVSGGSVLLSQATGTVIADINWHHIALTIEGTGSTKNVKVYVDGVQASSGSVSGNASFSGVLSIGDVNGGNFVNGYMDEIRMSKGVIRWTSNFTPPIIPYGDIANDMTLLANVQVATIVPTDARIILFEEDVDSVTINTDLKAYVSRDNGTTFSQVTLEDEGNYITGARILTGVVDISAQPSGSNIKYKIETLNNKKLNLHGTAVSYK